MTESAADKPEETTEPTTADAIATTPDAAAATAAADETDAIAGSATPPEDAGVAAAKAEAEAAALQELPRPRWRFSGKRGRPVHERDAVNKLPAEVRDVVEQFVRTVQDDSSKDSTKEAAQPTSAAPETAPTPEPTQTPEAPAVSDPTTAVAAVAETTTGDEPTSTHSDDQAATSDIPAPSAGSTESQLAVALLGQPPVQPLVTADESALTSTPEQPAAAEEPATASEAASDTAAEEAPAAPATPAPTTAGARPARRGRSRRVAAKRRRASLGWEQPAPAAQTDSTPPLDASTAQAAAPEPSTAAAPAKRTKDTPRSASPRSTPRPKQKSPSAKSSSASTEAPRTTRRPDAIARLDQPLHVENVSNGLVEPRVARRRSIARRAELDAALADLQSFVEASGTRR